MSIDVVSHFTNIRLLADIFNRSSGFDQLNYGDVLMLSETGFTHRDSFVSRSMTLSLNVNSTIMWSNMSTWYKNVYGYFTAEI